MLYLFLSLLLFSNQEGVNQIKNSKYAIEDLSGFNPEIIKHRKIDSIQIVLIRGKDSILTSALKFNIGGHYIEKIEFLPDKSINKRTEYQWEKDTLKSQTIASYFIGKIDQVTKIEYDYTFPKIISQTRDHNQEITSVKVKEYDIKDSLLINELNYSVEKGKHQLSTTANYSYSVEGNIIVNYYDENKELGLTTVSEKSKYVNSISVFGILPDGEIEDTRILFYDKDNNLIKSITNRNSISSTTVRIYKDGLLHQEIYPTYRYVYKYYFKGK